MGMGKNIKARMQLFMSNELVKFRVLKSHLTDFSLNQSVLYTGEDTTKLKQTLVLPVQQAFNPPWSITFSL